MIKGRFVEHIPAGKRGPQSGLVVLSRDIRKSSYTVVVDQ